MNSPGQPQPSDPLHSDSLASDDELLKLTKELLKQVALRLKAMGHPTRLMILHSLEAGERTVAEILAVCGGTQANTSKHLNVLRHADLVESRRVGMKVYYRTRDRYIFGVCQTVCDSILQQATHEAKRLERAREALESRLRRPPAAAPSVPVGGRRGDDT